MLISTCKKQKESQLILILSAFYCLYEEIIRGTYPFRIPSSLAFQLPLFFIKYASAACAYVWMVRVRAYGVQMLPAAFALLSCAWYYGDTYSIFISQCISRCSGGVIDQFHIGNDEEVREEVSHSLQGFVCIAFRIDGNI